MESDSIVPVWISVVVFIAIFGTVVFMGIHIVYYVNRRLGNSLP